MWNCRRKLPTSCIPRQRDTSAPTSGSPSSPSRGSAGSKTMFYILYPERRVVSTHPLARWYTDAVANGQVEDCGPCSVQAAANALHQAGLITLQHGDNSVHTF